MEAITVKARKNRSGNFTFSFPHSKENELDVIIISTKENINKKKKADYSAIFGKGKDDKIDWIEYQKKIRNEWD